MFVRFWRLGCRCYVQKFTNKTVSSSCTSKFYNYNFSYFVNMPPKRKANKPTEEVVDAGQKKKRIDKEEFDGEEGDDIDVKSTENIKPKRGAKAAEQKPAPAIESKSRTKGKAPVAKNTKKDPKDAVKSNLNDEESDSSVESKKDAPVKPIKKIEKKALAPEPKRKARGGNEGPSAKSTKHDDEVSPFIEEEDEDDEVPASSSKSSKAAPKSKGRGAKATQSKAKVAKKNEDVVEVVPEEEPELSPVEEEPKKKPAATKASKKMIPEVIEDEEIELDDSSEDEFQKKTTTAKVTKKNAKKHSEEEVEPEDVSSDESKKKAPVSKRGKRNVKKDAIQKDESEPEDDAASGDSQKTFPGGKGSKKEVIQEEGSEPEDVSSDDSKKNVAVTKGVKKMVKKEAGTASASRGRPAKKEKLNPTETSYETLDFSSDKKNAAGDVHNLRIASWNVGGIKTWVKKDGLKYVLQEKPDIFCMQETKCNGENYPPEIEEIEGYKFYWHASSKNGYAGVSLWSRIEPIEIQYGIGNEEQDEDGRCITAEFEKYYVISVYVPNSGRKLVNLAKRLEWNKLFKNFVKELDAKKPVIICGDLNVAHSEIDLANPKTNTKNAGFTPEEREGFTEFLSEGFIDTYRNFNPDATGAYTFWTYMFKSRSKNVGWRLDYFVTSDRLKDNLCDSLIRSSVLGSDHCPIVLFVNI